MRGVVKFPIAGPPYALSVVRYDTIINHSKSISPGGLCCQGRGPVGFLSPILKEKKKKKDSICKEKRWRLLGTRFQIKYRSSRPGEMVRRKKHSAW